MPTIADNNPTIAPIIFPIVETSPETSIEPGILDEQVYTLAQQKNEVGKNAKESADEDGGGDSNEHGDSAGKQQQGTLKRKFFDDTSDTEDGDEDNESSSVKRKCSTSSETATPGNNQTIRIVEILDDNEGPKNIMPSWMQPRAPTPVAEDQKALPDTSAVDPPAASRPKTDPPAPTIFTANTRTSAVLENNTMPTLPESIHIISKEAARLLLPAHSPAISRTCKEVVADISDMLTEHPTLLQEIAQQIQNSHENEAGAQEPAKDDTRGFLDDFIKNAASSEQERLEKERADYHTYFEREQEQREKRDKFFQESCRDDLTSKFINMIIDSELDIEKMSKSEAQVLKLILSAINTTFTVVFGKYWAYIKRYEEADFLIIVRSVGYILYTQFGKQLQAAVITSTKGATNSRCYILAVAMVWIIIRSFQKFLSVKSKIENGELPLISPRPLAATMPDPAATVSPLFQFPTARPMQREQQQQYQAQAPPPPQYPYQQQQPQQQYQAPPGFMPPLYAGSPPVEPDKMFHLPAAAENQRSFLQPQLAAGPIFFRPTQPHFIK